MSTYYQMNENFLAHYGVPGMKWGRRKARSTSSGTSRIRSGKNKKSNSSNNSSSQSDRRKKNVKKALKVGAAVAGTALAAYGGYKLHKFVNDKNRQIQIDRGKKAMDEILGEYKHTSGTAKLKNGKYQMMTRSARGTGIHEGSAKDIERARRYINTVNEGVIKRANDAYSEHVNVGTKMNFGQKAANVANYYVKRKKK